MVGHQAEVLSYRSWLNNFQPTKSHVISCFLSTVKMDEKDFLLSVNNFKWLFTPKGLTKYCSSVFNFHGTSVTSILLNLYDVIWLDEASVSCREFWRPQKHSYICHGVDCIEHLTWEDGIFPTSMMLKHLH